MSRNSIKTTLLTAAASLTLAACATVPGSDVAAGSPITPAERQQGTEADPQLIAEFGGEMSGPQADYVKNVGNRIAAQSGLGTAGQFDVALLNSSVDNAFAIPGGYVYVTRQLVSLMNNEAELAAVLGHEVGHVAARHSARRAETAQRNNILGVLGQVLAGAVLGNSGLGQLGQQIASTAPQLATLSFSRSQELEADGLGIQYLTGAGYDPHAMGTVLASLAAQNSLDASLMGSATSVPEWASTHPDPASRVQSALQRAGAGTGRTDRDTFLTRVDGLLYGDDPQQGVVEGRQFIHPVYRFEFTAPQGFYLLNGTQAVSITGTSGKGQLSTEPYSGNLDTYVRTVFQKIGGSQQTLAPQSIQRTTVNGLPAAFGTARVTSGQSQVDVTVFAYQFSNSQAFHFATITPAGQQSAFTAMYNSMRRISESEAAQVIPRRLDVVTVQRGDTVQSLAQKMAYTTAQVERFRVLNGLASNATLTPGQKVKLVIRSR
jgi:predicted Zn-dependent protease